MRPVTVEHVVSQYFASMATQGVIGNINAPTDTPEYWVGRYGNYQQFGHAGMDFSCPIGTRVYAMADGVVLYAGWGYNLPGTGPVRKWLLYKDFPGIVTVIQHPGWIGVYAHLSDNDAAPAGTTVTMGQLIGLSGNTGGVDPHLHVEALVDLTYRTGGGLIYGRTDPSRYFGGIAAQGTTTAQEDDMANVPQAEWEWAKQVLTALSDNAATKKDLGELPDKVLTQPVPYKDPITGEPTGQTTSLATMAGYADFQATQTRLNTNAKTVAASIPDNIAREVVELLAARLGGK